MGIVCMRYSSTPVPGVSAIMIVAVSRVSKVGVYMQQLTALALYCCWCYMSEERVTQYMYGKGKYAFLLLLVVFQAFGEPSIVQKMGLPPGIRRPSLSECTKS